MLHHSFVSWGVALVGGGACFSKLNACKIEQAPCLDHIWLKPCTAQDSQHDRGQAPLDHQGPSYTLEVLVPKRTFLCRAVFVHGSRFS